MIKRLLDIIVSLSALVLFFPILIFLAVAVYLKIGKPILFKQRRPGKNENVFLLLKFRTMTNQTSITGDLLPDAQRLTSFGALLRRTSLDELPSLLNVLKGDMSLVGPRPLLEKYLDFYNIEQRRRHLVRPGITGWAQVNGRNNISWHKKFEYDIWYVENGSFWLDIKILFLTMKKVFLREGINKKGEATMSEFRGEEHDK